jgi:hypothetical protein
MTYVPAHEADLLDHLERELPTGRAAFVLEGVSRISRLRERYLFSAERVAGAAWLVVVTMPSGVRMSKSGVQDHQVREELVQNYTRLRVGIFAGPPS